MESYNEVSSSVMADGKVLFFFNLKHFSADNLVENLSNLYQNQLQKANIVDSCDRNSLYYMHNKELP